jgi:tRNA1(Val) A37 N6-methylase TrmN6
MTELALTEDALLGGAVRLLQPAKGHRAGTDAVLLAAAASPETGAHIVDAGAGTGAVGLMVLFRVPSARLTLVERDPDLAALCARNLALNGRHGHVAAADLLDPHSRRGAGLEPESADWVVTNPPFLEEGRARISPDPNRAAAHALPPGGLVLWLRACAGLLKPNGRLALIHRADRVGDCLAALDPGFGGIRLRLIHPQAARPAIRLLITAVKGSRAPLLVEPPLILHESSGRFTPDADALHRGEGFLV